MGDPSTSAEMRITSLWRRKPDGELAPRDELSEAGDAAAKERTLAYLRRGSMVLGAPMLEDDVLDPSRRNVVPVGYQTDGQWIWPIELAYYLEAHDLWPERDFQQHIAARNYALPTVSDEVASEAAQVLQQLGRSRS